MTNTASVASASTSPKAASSMPSSPRHSFRMPFHLGMTPVNQGQEKQRSSSGTVGPRANAAAQKNGRSFSAQHPPLSKSAHSHKNSVTQTPSQPRRRRFNDTRELDILRSEVAAQSRAARSGTSTPRSFGPGMSAAMSTESLFQPNGFGSPQMSPYMGQMPYSSSQGSLLRVNQSWGSRPGLSPSSSQLDVTGFSNREAAVRSVQVPEGMGIGVGDSPYPTFAKQIDAESFAAGNSLRGPAMMSNPDLLQDSDVYAVRGGPPNAAPQQADATWPEPRTSNSAWQGPSTYSNKSPVLSATDARDGLAPPPRLPSSPSPAPSNMALSSQPSGLSDSPHISEPALASVDGPEASSTLTHPREGAKTPPRMPFTAAPTTAPVPPTSISKPPPSTALPASASSTSLPMQRPTMPSSPSRRSIFSMGARHEASGLRNEHTASASTTKESKWKSLFGPLFRKKKSHPSMPAKSAASSANSKPTSGSTAPVTAAGLTAPLTASSLSANKPEKDSAVKTGNDSMPVPGPTAPAPSAPAPSAPAPSAPAPTAPAPTAPAAATEPETVIVTFPVSPRAQTQGVSNVSQLPPQRPPRLGPISSPPEPPTPPQRPLPPEAPEPFSPSVVTVPNPVQPEPQASASVYDPDSVTPPMSPSGPSGTTPSASASAFASAPVLLPYATTPAAEYAPAPSYSVPSTMASRPLSPVNSMPWNLQTAPATKTAAEPEPSSMYPPTTALFTRTGDSASSSMATVPTDQPLMSSTTPSSVTSPLSVKSASSNLLPAFGSTTVMSSGPSDTNWPPASTLAPPPHEKLGDPAPDRSFHTPRLSGASQEVPKVSSQAPAPPLAYYYPSPSIPSGATSTNTATSTLAPSLTSNPFYLPSSSLTPSFSTQQLAYHQEVEPANLFATPRRTSNIVASHTYSPQDESVHVHGHGIGGDDDASETEDMGMPLSRSMQEMIRYTLLQPSALDTQH
ncbi:hypothetical protein Malapachy_1889 [Malassezia pachydermatis]|uniref:Uncharacterized protein n=1 Tax=Malassezia pachydermatis TaxID=77020 RepID=A0A0M8MLC7_9BASI|nr:hypothetical protein Malapachy_1889 [Malassezia pachydermatis]KOS13888.1 hypothetical protein Malapachy_1889 [Malassezia pachydermatis]